MVTVELTFFFPSLFLCSQILFPQKEDKKCIKGPLLITFEKNKQWDTTQYVFFSFLSSHFLFFLSLHFTSQTTFCILLLYFIHISFISTFTHFHPIFFPLSLFLLCDLNSTILIKPTTTTATTQTHIQYIYNYRFTIVILVNMDLVHVLAVFVEMDTLLFANMNLISVVNAFVKLPTTSVIFVCLCGVLIKWEY